MSVRISMVTENGVVSAGRGGGSQARRVAELSVALERLGHTVVTHTRQGNAEDFAAELVQQWRPCPPDVVHSHFRTAGLGALMAARELGVPVVQTFNALGSATHPGLDRLLGQHATRIVAAWSDEVVELVRMGVPRSRVSVVPYGVDAGRFAPTGPAAPRGQRRRIVSAGRLIARKGHDVPIAALTRLPDAELVIAGGPDAAQLAGNPEALRLRRIAEHYGVADRVELLGNVAREDMPALLRSADVVVCTPWHATSGAVSLEAMACGVPVVAAATGDLLDTVVDGVTGRHVPLRDPAALARVLRPLLADPMTGGAYGAAGRDRALARYSWERIALDTVQVYERVLDRTGVPQRV